MTLSYVARAAASTSSGDNYTTMPISVPTSRQVDDLMLVGVGSHSGDVSLPTGFTELHSPSGGFVIGYMVSASSGGGTVTATSGGGSHGRAWLALIRGYSASTHELAADGFRDTNASGTLSLPALTERGGDDSLQILTAFRRFGSASWTLTSPSGATERWEEQANWGSAFWTRPSTTADAGTISTSSSGSEAAGWNAFIYEPVRLRPTVGYIGLG